MGKQNSPIIKKNMLCGLFMLIHPFHIKYQMIHIVNAIHYSRMQTLCSVFFSYLYEVLRFSLTRHLTHVF